MRYPAAAGFLEALPHGDRVVVFCHFDADGLAAGALFGRALPRLGFADVHVVHSLRGESAYSRAARVRLEAYEPRALIVADLGVEPDPILHGVPTLIVDHHEPHGEPELAVVVSGHGQDPTPTSAWLAHDILRAAADISDLDWIAAVGVIGDLGDRAPWPPLPDVRRRFTGKWLKEAVALINAARRSSAFDVATPLTLLLRSDHPRAIAQDDALGADRLRAYRAEVRAETERARRIAPVFSGDRRHALITFASACQIHPLIAELWRRRLAGQVVIAANTGYLPGIVAFAARTARQDVNLPESFARIALGIEKPASYGRGHARASGGHLPPHAFNRLLDALGFDETAHVEVPA